MPEPVDAVRLAIQAAGQLDEGWETRVFMAVPMVAGLLREQSQATILAQQVLEADGVIYGEYLGKQLEESSQRIIVSFHADNSAEPETMRTHRVDEPAGRAMEVRLYGIKPGERCLFFKHTEQLDRKRSVRNLVHIERQPSRNARPATPPQRSGGTGAERPAGEVPRPPAEAPAPNQSVAEAVRGLLRTLDHDQRVKAQDMLRQQGWASAEDIPETEWERAMYIVRFQRTDHF